MSPSLRLLCIIFIAFSPAFSPSQSPAVKSLSFISDVAPILKDNCFACHDAKKRKGKLDMTTFENFRKGGDKEDPIEPGKPEESEIIDRITDKGASRMPPKEGGEPLPQAKIDIITRWIKEGAKLDTEISPKA